MTFSEKVCYDITIPFRRSTFLKPGQFGSLNLQFRFWLPDCPLSVAKIILLSHTDGEDNSNVRYQKWNLKYQPGAKLEPFLQTRFLQVFLAC